MSEWIKITNPGSLPPYDTPVLVWVYGNYNISRLERNKLANTDMWVFEEFDLIYESFDDVKAWMPLPEPYVEKEDTHE